MANTTFNGAVRSENGFKVVSKNTSTGAVSTSFTLDGGGITVAPVAIAADTTLTFAANAGRVMEINDADCKVTLPAITTATLGATYSFFIGTDATDLDIKTDGTDKFSGNVVVAGGSGEARAFASDVSSNDVMTMNGTTTGGKVGSTVTATAIGTAEYLITGVLIGSSNGANPFADA